ncbi:MAG: TlyA family rRNA (cytidine-2'-O)-methyltransferase [Patescibacteria group bacterium]|nr:TlyA family rRNA (cytidine-2'-O)-methyltransferase [Patescibacteria group bacterium]
MNTLFASRAGEKLDHAINEFKIDVRGKTCADFGSSVGGFVDCLLQHGATKVYAVETGYGQLAWKLRQDKRVVVMERTNAMHIMLPEKVDLITNDTSWTKQKNILPNILKNLKSEGTIITLIKPHYEAEKKLLHKGVLDMSVAEIVAHHSLEEIQSMGFKVLGFTKSPIIGGKGGNTEYLAYLSYHE